MSSSGELHNQEASSCSYNNKVLLAAVISLSVVVSFVLLLHIYARWLLRRRPIVANLITEPLPLHRRRPITTTTIPGVAVTEMTRVSMDGLDAKDLASLPTFVYKRKEHEAAMDCVVCLSVMEEDEKGRVLPVCKHAFHMACIDVWLMSHSTCPICRAAVKVEEKMDEVVVVVLGGAAEEVGEEETRREEEEEEAVGDHVEIAVSSCNGENDVGKEGGSSSSSSSSSLSCSLKRMLSRSRSESRVFPSSVV
ncbi:RING-H2 finger protein ATL5-like [Typha angustifolia]|uniref:RING-H2 finger protein ATL5-like n=1 Tax=Typha angustifolia TaxID=59011 RepID=UPI003C2BFAFE